MARTREMRDAVGETAGPFRAIGRKDLDRLPELRQLGPDQRLAVRVVSAVLPFRVNPYVLGLIDWDAVPDDPVFQLTFPQREMLEPADFRQLRDLMLRGDDEGVAEAVRRIRDGMNPHPAGQRELNVPRLDGDVVPGVQHKYRETVLFFPSRGQTCHAYCTYCFRWAQFVGEPDLRFAAREVDTLLEYLRVHPEVTDVLFTGGDPMIMKTRSLARYVEPLLEGPGSVQTLRFGTKALGYWPQRFLTDPDADDLLRLFEQIVQSGKHLAFMAHFSHPRELETSEVREAMRRILGTGAVIRCQAPLIRRVNDDAETWARMWSMQVQLGAVPYYMFVERDTGPRDYFQVPLSRALDIFQEAYQNVSGLARTVRGPSMSATPGKVLVDGRAHVNGQDAFVLKFLQGRDPAWTERVFFAREDPEAAWLDDLEPISPEEAFFFEAKLGRFRERGFSLLTGTD